jgi:hypothetical protein
MCDITNFNIDKIVFELPKRKFISSMPIRIKKDLTWLDTHRFTLLRAAYKQSLSKFNLKIKRFLFHLKLLKN